MADVMVFRYKQRVKIGSGFFGGFRGRLILEGDSKYLVRFRIGMFRRIDAWIDADLLIP